MSNYIIYTTDNGVLNFKNDLRVFIGRNNVNINNWNKIYTSIKDSFKANYVSGKTLPANEKIKIADISIDKQYIMRNITILTTLSFTTSDYVNISEDDTISFTIEFNTSNNQNSYKFTYPLHKMYLQTIQFFKTIRYSTADLKKISIYLTSTFPLTLRWPSNKTATYARTYIYVVSI